MWLASLREFQPGIPSFVVEPGYRFYKMNTLEEASKRRGLFDKAMVNKR